MKRKTWALVLAAAAALSMTACGRTGKDQCGTSHRSDREKGRTQADHPADDLPRGGDHCSPINRS